MKHSDPLCLAIDLGTSGPKVALLTFYGDVIASAFFPTDLIFTGSGGVEQCPKQWWKGVSSGIHQVLGQSESYRKRVSVMCCTSQWSGTIPVDESLKPLMNCMTWMDSRGAGNIQKLNRSWMRAKGYHPYKMFQWIRKTGGLPGQSGKDPLAHILFIKSSMPEVYQKTRWFLEPKDYLNMKLTGIVASSYDTISLHWLTDNRNPHKINYDSSLIRMCGLSPDYLPPLFPSTSVLGPLKPELCREFGLPDSVRVINGSPDVQSAAVGSGAVLDYQMHLYIGTSSWMTCHVPFKKTALLSGIATLPSALPGKYFVANEQESAGICIDYLRKDLFPAKIASERLRNNHTCDFETLESMAASAPTGSRQLMFTPWLNGERTPVDDHKLRGGFHNISLTNKPEDFIRSVYEGVAYNSRWLMSCVSSLTKRPVGSVHMIGGGALSNIWCQIHADILDCPVIQVKDPKHANLRGAAWIAALAMGELSVSDIGNFVVTGNTYRPNPLDQTLHSDRFQEFKNIYKSNRKIHQRLNHQL